MWPIHVSATIVAKCRTGYWSRPIINVPLYAPQVRTGVEQVDEVIENFLARKFEWRRDMIRTVAVACTTDGFEVGHPRCPGVSPAGTEMEVFPYREHRVVKYVNPDELDQFLEFPPSGLYAVYRVSQSGFEAEWMPSGEYSVIFVAQEGELGVELVVDEDGKVVRIEFWPLTPVEVLDGTEFDYLLPPLGE